MAPTYNRDIYLRLIGGCSFTYEQARKIDKYINSMVTGNISYHWTGGRGGKTYYNHY